jgi:hypothetical protein
VWWIIWRCLLTSLSRVRKHQGDGCSGDADGALGWVRTIFAEGPRVVINALTFISVTQADVIIQEDSSKWGGWEKFGANVEALWNANEMQVLSLGTMAFTSLIWIFTILRVR